MKNQLTCNKLLMLIKHASKIRQSRVHLCNRLLPLKTKTMKVQIVMMVLGASVLTATNLMVKRRCQLVLGKYST